MSIQAEKLPGRVERIVTWRWTDVPIKRVEEKEESEGEDEVMQGEGCSVYCVKGRGEEGSGRGRGEGRYCVVTDVASSHLLFRGNRVRKK